MTRHAYSLAGVLITGVILFLCPLAKAQDPRPRPTGSISGHVLINNKSAAGVEVAAMGGEVINRRIPAAQTKTDSEGYYHLEGLAAGNYQVTTLMPHLVAAEANQDYQFNGYYASAKGILLAEGENVTDIDIKLVRGGVITGRVTDAEDKPVVEERISLQPVIDPGAPRVTRLPPPIGQMYQTDDRGIYRIYGLSAGRYRVSAGRNGAQLVGSLSGFYQLTYHPDVTDPGRATIIDLAEGDEAKNVDIRLGRHEDAFDIDGRVIDAETGLPMASVRVGVLMPQGSISLGPGMQTAADGKFAIPGVTKGHYGIYVSSDSGESDFYSDPVFVDVVDKEVSGVELRAIRGITINGSIVGENIELKDLLKQVVGLRVSANVVPADGRTTASTIRSFGSGTVAADGSFVVTGLRPGRAMLSLMSSDPSKRPSVAKITVGGVGVTQGFEIERGQPVSGVQILVSYGTGIIRGSVTFQGAPLANYRTEIICRREGSRTFAGGASLDARGHFVLRQLAPGAYDCGLQYINIAGGPAPRPPQAQHQSVTVSNGAESELNFVIDLTPKGVAP